MTSKFIIYSTFVPADGINLSAPWRLGKSPGGRALTAEQEAELASRFEFKPKKLKRLSKSLSNMLDPTVVPAWELEDVSTLVRIGEAKAHKASDALAMCQKQLTDQLRELESLMMGPGASAEDNARFRQTRIDLANAIGRIQEAQDGLQQTLKSPGRVLLNAPPDKRRVPDQRRMFVLLCIFDLWRKAGRPMTYSTDPITSKRGGPLIEFINAVVTCITDPPTELSGQTIAKDLKGYLRARREDLEWFKSRYPASESAPIDRAESDQDT